MGGNTKSKAENTDSSSSKTIDNFLKGQKPSKPLSDEIPEDLNKNIVVGLGRIDEDAVIVDGQGNYDSVSKDASMFQIEVKNAETGTPVPGLDVQVSLIRRDGLRFGPYKFPFLCGVDSICYSRALDIPEGKYQMEAVIRPEKRYKDLEDLVGSVKAVFNQVEVS